MAMFSKISCPKCDRKINKSDIIYVETTIGTKVKCCPECVKYIDVKRVLPLKDDLAIPKKKLNKKVEPIKEEKYFKKPAFLENQSEIKSDTTANLFYEKDDESVIKDNELKIEETEKDEIIQDSGKDENIKGFEEKSKPYDIEDNEIELIEEEKIIKNIEDEVLKNKEIDKEDIKSPNIEEKITKDKKTEEIQEKKIENEEEEITKVKSEKEEKSPSKIKIKKGLFSKYKKDKEKDKKFKDEKEDVNDKKKEIDKESKISEKNEIYNIELDPLDLKVLKIINENKDIEPKEIAKNLGEKNKKITESLQKLENSGLYDKKYSESIEEIIDEEKKLDIDEEPVLKIEESIDELKIEDNLNIIKKENNEEDITQEEIIKEIEEKNIKSAETEEENFDSIKKNIEIKKDKDKIINEPEKRITEEKIIEEPKIEIIEKEFDKSKINKKSIELKDVKDLDKIPFGKVRESDWLVVSKNVEDILLSTIEKKEKLRKKQKIPKRKKLIKKRK